MRKYYFLKAIFLSFFSRALYRDVVNNWGANTLGYLFLLLALMWAILMSFIQPNINQVMTKLVNEMAVQMPATLHLEKGVLSTAENRPYFIKSAKEGSVIAVIDTSGKIESINNANAHFLITNHSIEYFNFSNQPTTYPLPTWLTFNVTSTVLAQQIINTLHWSWLILFPLCVILSFIYHILECCLYAIIGKIMVGLMHVSLHYLDLVKLAMVASTPTILISTLLNGFDYWFRYQWWFYVAVSLSYLFFAIRANKLKN